MNKLVTALLMLLFATNLNAQPGYEVIGLPDASGQRLNSLNSFYYHYAIDSATDFSKFKNLKGIKSINLHAYLKSLPKEMAYLSDSLQEIWIDGNHHLEDLSALKTLKNLKSITVEFYDGKELPDLSDLPNLESVTIEDYYFSNLISVSGLSGCRNLKKLKILSGSLNKFDLDVAAMNLEELDLEYCNSLHNIDIIAASKSLKRLSLFYVSLTRLPPDFNQMPKLAFLDLTGLPVNNISCLNHMKALSDLRIYGCDLNEIPGEFKTNKKIDTIDIQYCRSLKSASGIAGLKNLRLLRIDDVDKNFVPPPLLFTCKNLEDLQIASWNSDISMIRDLPELKKLSLEFFQFEKLPESLFTNQNIEDLDIVGNKKVTDLRGITRFKNLKKLRLFLNTELVAIPDLPKEMPQLTEVQINNNNKLVIPEEFKRFNPKWDFKKY